MKYRARVDANQGVIVAALRAVGCFVQSIAMVGRGAPDLLCGCRGRWFVLEVKDGSKPPSAQALTPDEAKWHAAAGPCAPVHVVATVEQALAVVTEQQ
jgi:hypothetical protein